MRRSCERAVNYETQVTWNEASQAATDPPILSTVAKIFIATGVFMVVTVVIGIAFGGVRIITKRLFPGQGVSIARTRLKCCSWG